MIQVYECQSHFIQWQDSQTEEYVCIYFVCLRIAGIIYTEITIMHKRYRSAAFLATNVTSETTEQM
jgi:hypothetical protein